MGWRGSCCIASLARVGHSVGDDKGQSQARPPAHNRRRATLISLFNQPTGRPASCFCSNVRRELPKQRHFARLSTLCAPIPLNWTNPTFSKLNWNLSDTLQPRRSTHHGWCLLETHVKEGRNGYEQQNNNHRVRRRRMRYGEFHARSWVAGSALTRECRQIIYNAATG